MQNIGQEEAALVVLAGHKPCSSLCNHAKRFLQQMDNYCVCCAKKYGHWYYGPVGHAVYNCDGTPYQEPA